jgi:hypothetical protein
MHLVDLTAHDEKSESMKLAPQLFAACVGGEGVGVLERVGSPRRLFTSTALCGVARTVKSERPTGNL